MSAFSYNIHDAVLWRMKAFQNPLISDIIILMSRKEKIINSVESNFSLEGMKFSSREKKVMRDCLSGKTSFDAAVKNVIARYRKV